MASSRFDLFSVSDRGAMRLKEETHGEVCKSILVEQRG